MTSITAIIPVYNRAPVVASAIDSILGQEVPAGWSVEVLVVDDDSTDDLMATLRPYGKRISCVRRSRNAGAAAARNLGVSAATTEFIAFLDSDDVWLPKNLAAQI